MNGIEESITDAAQKVAAFLSSFNAKKVAIFYDDDPDGICSGTLLEHFFTKKGYEIVRRYHFSEKNLPFSESFKKDLEKSEAELLVFTDYCISGFGFYEAYKSFIESTTIPILIFDHHQDTAKYTDDTKRIVYLNSNIIQNEISGSQYCCSKFVYDIITKLDETHKKYRWLAAIGIIGDTNYIQWGDFIKELISSENKKIEKEIIIPHEPEDYNLTPYGKASAYIFFGIAKGDVAKIYKIIQTSPTVFVALEKLKQYEVVKREVYDYVENYEYLIKMHPKTDKEFQVAEIEIKSNATIGSIVANIISAKFPETIFFIYHIREDGFAYINVRLQKGSINLGTIMKKCAQQFEHANGGGHKEAAGARIPEEHFKSFRNHIYGALENV